MNIQMVYKVICILASLGFGAYILITIIDVVDYAKSYYDKKILVKDKEISYTYFLNKEDTDYNLDKFINELFRDYLIINGIAEGDYIKEDLKRKMITDMKEMVNKFMSTNLRNYLLMLYSDEGLDELINIRVTILVCYHVNESNSIKE